MIKNILVFSALLALFALWGRSLQAQFGGLDIASSDVPVVVELFTSQSCSSCPPADKILEELSQHENVIALGCHVTYWDHLHWKDTLSQDFCTQRQRLIAAQNDSKRVYTPQMVVNGEAEFVGSRSGQVNAEIAKAIRKNDVQPIAIKQLVDGDFKITVPDSKSAGPFVIWVFGTKSQQHQKMESGENRGRAVTYVNSALYQHKLKKWDGKAFKQIISLPANDQIDGIIVLAQNQGYSAITAAGKLALN